MEAVVVRNGQHQGERFVEVSHAPDGAHASPLTYAVPVSAELPLGTVVEISVKVKEVPKEPAASLEGSDVSVANAPEPVVEESPIVAESEGEAATSPSGQSSDEGEVELEKQEAGDDETRPRPPRTTGNQKKGGK